MTKLLLTLAAGVTLAGSALADAPAPIRLTLAAPVAQDGPVQGLATRWSCTGASCTGPDLNARYGDARACREAAKVVGAITSYASARGPFDADALAKCNKAARAG